MALILMVGVIAGAAGFVVIFMFTGRSGNVKDVGELEAMAPIQAQIRGLSGCRFSYNVDRKRKTNDAIAIYPCRAGFPSGARLPVPAGFKYGHLRFEGKRSSNKDRWEILVDTAAVPFPELQAALTELAPIMARDYEAAQLKATAAEEKAQRDYEEAERNRKSAKEKSQQTYPTK